LTKNLAILLLEWYAVNGRDLPWRFKGGAHPDPYAVLVSEIMLQQTTVKTVLSYFERFMKRFPNVQTLAAAELEDVYLYWQGLGYYSRARSLHAAAKTIAWEMDGCFPQTPAEVKRLKGVGPYTMASYLALAFNLPQTVVDGNVMRIICRLYHLTAPIDEILPLIRQKAESLTDQTHPADYASAIMDLGATVCTPAKPQCNICPWRDFCQSRDKPDVAMIPQRLKVPKKDICAYVYLIFDKHNRVYIRKRTQKGLLSGLYEFLWSEKALFANAEETSMTVSHVFTHIRLELKICFVRSEMPDGDGFFVDVSELDQYPFSTLMKKVAKKALLQA